MYFVIISEFVIHNGWLLCFFGVRAILLALMRRIVCNIGVAKQNSDVALNT